MTPAEHLRAACKLITPEGAWTQGAFARDEHGNETSTASPRAVCWCATGALWSFKTESEASFFLRKITGTYAVSAWNDYSGRTQDEVLAAFDKAIELAETQS